MNSTDGKILLSKRIIKNQFDNSGKLIEVKEVVSNKISDTFGFLLSHRLLKYKGDKVWKEEEMVSLNSGMPVNRGTIEYQYDLTGNLISIKSKLVASRFYTYNQKGLLSTKKTVMPGEFDNILFRDNYRYTLWK